MDNLPFKCGICNHVYKNVSSLKRHRRDQHNNKRYHCADCDKSYSRPDNVYRHRRQAHYTLKAKELKKPAAVKTSHQTEATTRDLVGLTTTVTRPVDQLQADLALSSDSETSLPDYSRIVKGPVTRITTATNTDKSNVTKTRGVPNF